MLKWLLRHRRLTKRARYNSLSMLQSNGTFLEGSPPKCETVVHPDYAQRAGEDKMIVTPFLHDVKPQCKIRFRWFCPSKRDVSILMWLVSFYWWRLEQLCLTCRRRSRRAQELFMGMGGRGVRLTFEMLCGEHELHYASLLLWDSRMVYFSIV